MQELEKGASNSMKWKLGGSYARRILHRSRDFLPGGFHPNLRSILWYRIRLAYSDL